MSSPVVGARLKSNSCTFTVWAPLRNKVELIIDNDKAHAMSKEPDGYWTVDIEGIGPGTRYGFRLDGKNKLPDPASRAQPDGVHGASAVVPEQFAWTDSAWRGLALGEMVIYELHVGTFTPAHNFEGIISKLPYLKELGVNAIELMPIAQFPGDRNWGYDGVFPFAVQHSYGGAEGLKKLVDASHASGIAVILDVVYNHQGPEGNYLQEYGPYFTDKYKTGWGQAINFDDAWCDGVRRYYWQNALMWLDEFHIDGLRLDAVHAIWDFSANHFIEKLVEQVRDLEERSGCRKVLIAEFDLNNPRYVRKPESGGYGLDGQWIDEFHHALHSLVTGEVDGYYEDFGAIEHLARAFRDTYVYTGQFSVHRKKLFGRKPEGTTCDQFVIFAQNHDQIGNRMLGDRLASTLSEDALKLTAATYLLAPYVPMLFMGEEYAEKSPFQYFISHSDKQLIEAVRKGRKQEFAYFKWEGEVPDPQSEETFQQCMLSWSVESDAKAREYFDYYKYLINFRRNRPAMQGTSRDAMKVRTFNNTLYIERTHGGDTVAIILNFGKSVEKIAPSNDRKMTKVFDSTLPPSTRQEGNSLPPGTPIDIKPLSVLIFEY